MGGGGTGKGQRMGCVPLGAFAVPLEPLEQLAGEGGGWRRVRGGRRAQGRWVPLATFAVPLEPLERLAGEGGGRGRPEEEVQEGGMGGGGQFRMMCWWRHLRLTGA